MYPYAPTYPSYDEHGGHDLHECVHCDCPVEEEWDYCPSCGSALERPDHVSSYLCCGTPMTHTRAARVRRADPSGLAALVAAANPEQDECLSCGAIWFNLTETANPIIREPDTWNTATATARFTDYLKTVFGVDLPSA